jgi:hypothetical protein
MPRLNKNEIEGIEKLKVVEERKSEAKGEKV